MRTSFLRNELDFKVKMISGKDKFVSSVNWYGG